MLIYSREIIFFIQFYPSPTLINTVQFLDKEYKKYIIPHFPLIFSHKLTKFLFELHIAGCSVFVHTMQL